VTPALLDGIHIERELLTSLRARASVLVDTTELSVHQLRRSVLDLFGPGSDGRRMRVRLVSFGFKYGAPVDADITLDVRFLHNPFFVPELKPLSGLDKPVVDYVLGSEDAKGWLSKTRSLLDFCIPRYEREGKSYLTIAVGCTGGRHRSVALAVELAGQLRGKHELEFDEVHRDVTRASERPARDDSPTQGARES
jgi:UPF0042 nucleotide-binding protein